MNTQIEQDFEGCRLNAYLDSVNVPTIGFGHTLGVQMGDTITMDQAKTFLLADLQTALDAVRADVTSPLTDDEESALVDLVFNIGAGNFAHSTLLRLLNAGDYQGAEAEFGKWNHAGGQVLAGLTRRRAAEAAMFDQGIT